MSKDIANTVSSPTKAVIYCRVSGARQVRDGDGLASQERRCREYAGHHHYEVVEVFHDDITGKLTDRPAMAAMLSFLSKHKSKREHVVIIDDISRFARDLRAHLELRSMLAKAGGKLESPSIEFGEDSDSLLIENLLASVAQHHREKNGEQTVNRMRARMMNGYWVFQAPIGYRFQRVGHHGKLMVRNEPLASIIQEALEGYASGRLGSQVEVKRYLESQPEFPKNKNGVVHPEKVNMLLKQPLYAGYMNHANWNLHLIKGHHEPLISLRTWQKIQDRLNGTAKAPARKDIREDFPLRGFVTCGDCGQPYTSCWSTGRLRKYPYYLCDTKGCVSYRKSVPRDEIEGKFETIVKELQPSETLINLVRAMFKAAWDQRYAQAGEMAARLKRELIKLDKQTEGFLDRIVEATNPSVITAYEKRIEKLDTEKRLIKEKLSQSARPTRSFDELIELTIEFLSNPWKIWSSGQLNMRRLVLKLAFADRLAYHRNTGYRTPELSLPFKLLGEISMNKKDMVPPSGLEPELR